LLKLISQVKTEKKAGEMAKTEMSINVPNFTSLKRITGSLYPTEKCAFCGNQPVEWQVTYPNGEWKLLCEKCGLNLQKKMEEKR